MQADSELITDAKAQDYHLHFDLENAPFSIESDNSLFVLSEGHERAIDKLYRALLGRKSMMLITGKPGTGKTLLLNTLMELAQEQCEFLQIHPEDLEGESAQQAQSPGRLSALVLAAAAVARDQEPLQKPQQKPQKDALSEASPHPSESCALLRNYIEQSRDNHRRPTIVIDEAQLLTNSALETLRCWSNMDDHKGRALQIVLAGHASLGDRLNTKALASLKQRIGMRCNLPALSLSETQRYIEHRCSLAGAARSLFERAIVIRIYSLTSGYPRLINTVADALLLQAFLRGGDSVSLSDVAHVSRDLDLRYAPIIRRPEPVTARPPEKPRPAASDSKATST